MIERCDYLTEPLENQRNYVCENVLSIPNCIQLESITQCWVWLAWGFVLIDKEEQHLHLTLSARHSCPLVLGTLSGAGWRNGKSGWGMGRWEGAGYDPWATCQTPFMLNPQPSAHYVYVGVQEQIPNSHCHQGPPTLGGNVGSGADQEFFLTSQIKGPSPNIPESQSCTTTGKIFIDALFSNWVIGGHARRRSPQGMK